MIWAVVDHGALGCVIADRYRLDTVLGSGGMGTVFAAVHTWTEREVAVKLLKPEYSDDADTLQRFFQEAKAAAALKHPNVVDVLDMGLDAEHGAFMVLERLQGESLAQLLEREAPVPVEKMMPLMLPVMDAVRTAHERGIIHRDIKPANIFVSRGQRGEIVPTLLDFGVAKLAQSELTKTGSVIGTAGYMSPEQLRGLKTLTPASDVWSLGVVWFYALSGELPHEANENPTVMLMAVLTTDPPKLRDIAPSVPEEIAKAVDGALRRSPETRHHTVLEFTEALSDAAQRAGIAYDDPRLSVPDGVF